MKNQRPSYKKAKFVLDRWDPHFAHTKICSSKFVNLENTPSI